jgi:hypothetical protein
MVFTGNPGRFSTDGAPAEVVSMLRSPGGL